MPSRLQTLSYAVGSNKQANISTASASFIHFDKLNATITSPNITFESDAAYIGKGGPTPEFATAAAPVAYDIKNSLEKYASAEFATWAIAYGLGDVAYASSTYTITPLDTRSSLELPYFTVVEQLTEGGSSAIDNAYLGCALNDFDLTFNSGPGRQSAKITSNWVASGVITSPSTVDIPTLNSDHYMLASSMALTINGEDYVSAKTIVSGSWKWSNNLNVKDGFFPGSGLQNGAAVMGRIEVGDRASTFEFTARLLNGSTEYTKLNAKTIGDVVLTLTYDGTHTVTVTLTSVQFTNVEYTSVDGIVCVKVMCTLLADPTFTNSLCSVSAKCGIATIGQ